MARYLKIVMKDGESYAIDKSTLIILLQKRISAIDLDRLEEDQLLVYAVNSLSWVELKEFAIYLMKHKDPAYLEEQWKISKKLFLDEENLF